MTNLDRAHEFLSRVSDGKWWIASTDESGSDQFVRLDEALAALLDEAERRWAEKVAVALVGNALMGATPEEVREAIKRDQEAERAGGPPKPEGGK